jgi:hypothetical protein
MTKAQVEVITSVQRRPHWSQAEKEQIVAAAIEITGEERVIEIEFASGGRMRISGPVDPSTVSALMKALAKGKRRR